MTRTTTTYLPPILPPYGAGRQKRGDPTVTGGCILCGRPVSDSGRESVGFDDSNTFIMDPSSPEATGYFPIGPECAKKVRKYVIFI